MIPNACFSELQKHQLLSRDEEGRLTARLKRSPCKRDRDRLITSNLRFVVKVAGTYRGCGLPLEDLVNEGTIGLIEAVSRFDPARGTRFLTYAKWWIQKAILDALKKQKLVRIPEHQHRELRLARREVDALRHRTGSRPGTDSPELERALEKRDALQKARPIELALEDVWGMKGESPVDDLMPSQNPIDPMSVLISDETSDIVHHAMTHLTPIQRTIICDRFGLDDKSPRTLQAIGDDLGISRERVRQIERESKDKIRRAVTARRGRKPRKPIPVPASPSASVQ